MLYRKGSILFGEIHEQPKVWKQIIESLSAQREAFVTWLKTQGVGQIIFVAAGDYLNVADSAARVMHLVSGLNSVALPVGEVMYERKAPYDARIKTLLVVLSRPDLSIETAWAVEKLKAMDPRASVLAVEFKEPSLASLAHHSLLFKDIEDKTKIGISSVSGMMLVCLLLVSVMSGKDVLWKELERLPQLVTDRLTEWQAKAQRMVQTKPNYIVFLGSGPFRGMANQGALSLTKMSGLPTAGNSFLEFWHGYHAAANNSVLVVGLLSNSFRIAEEKALGDLATTRAHRVAIAEDLGQSLMRRSDDVFELQSGVSEITRILLVLPVMQLLGFYAAMSRGVNPDSPKHLEFQTGALKEPPTSK